MASTVRYVTLREDGKPGSEVLWAETCIRKSNESVQCARYNWPMSAHASQAFSIAHCTDSEDLPTNKILPTRSATAKSENLTLLTYQISCLFSRPPPVQEVTHRSSANNADLSIMSYEKGNVHG